MKRNPFRLSAFDAIRNPDSMPLIMRRAVANLFVEYKTGRKEGRASVLRDPGSDLNRFIAAFNIISTQFTRYKLIQGRRQLLDLTAPGQRAQDTLPRRDAEEKRDRVKRFAKMEPAERKIARAKRAVPVRKKLMILDEALALLKADLEAGTIKERQT